MKLAVVCVGGGRGERFGGDKLASPLAGRTVLESSLTRLVTALPDVPLAVVLPRATLAGWRNRLAPHFPTALWTEGGARRQDSVRAGVEAVATTGADTVVVHDAARPLVDPADVLRVVKAAADADGAILCARVVDTVKRVDAGGIVLGTVARDELRLAQTPQVFRIAALRRAWAAVDAGHEATDESVLLEAAGLTVRTVVATRPNPKLTLPEDLAALQRLAAEEA